jgi:hypothetical protein
MLGSLHVLVNEVSKVPDTCEHVWSSIFSAAYQTPRGDTNHNTGTFVDKRSTTVTRAGPLISFPSTALVFTSTNHVGKDVWYNKWNPVVSFTACAPRYYMQIDLLQFIGGLVVWIF